MNANKWDDILPADPNRVHRDSFGSVFSGSLENMQESGSGNGGGHIGQFGLMVKILRPGTWGNSTLHFN